MITEDYVSFEVAKLLKENGFLKDVDLRMTQNLSFYDNIGLHHNLNKWYDSLIQDKIDFVVAPTHQMAMKWLREMHKIQICVEQNPYDAWHYWGFSMSYIDEKINELPNPTQAFIHICPTKIPNNCYKTYEEAVEVALKYCLENLI